MDCTIIHRPEPFAGETSDGEDAGFVPQKRSRATPTESEDGTQLESIARGKATVTTSNSPSRSASPEPQRPTRRSLVLVSESPESDQPNAAREPEYSLPAPQQRGKAAISDDEGVDDEDADLHTQKLRDLSESRSPSPEQDFADIEPEKVVLCNCDSTP